MEVTLGKIGKITAYEKVIGGFFCFFAKMFCFFGVFGL